LKVVAANKAGQGAESNIVTCYTVTIPGQPGKPELVHSTSTSIEIKWGPAFDDGGSPIYAYEVDMDMLEGIGQANVESWINVFSGEALSFKVETGLIAKMQYRFRVRAISEYQKYS